MRPEVLQYRSQALLSRRNTKKPGWSLNLLPNLASMKPEAAKRSNALFLKKFNSANEEEFAQKWKGFLNEVGCSSEEQFFQLLVFYGSAREGANDPPLHIFLDALKDYFQSYAANETYARPNYGADDPYYGSLKDSRMIKAWISLIAQKL